MQSRSPLARLLALATITSLAAVVPAQSFALDFEPGPATPGTAPIPTGWVSVNNSVGGPGTNPDWQVTNDGLVFPAFSGSTFAFANYNSATGANDISNYLISPLLTLSNGDAISFYTRTVDFPAYADRLELVFNTTGSTNPADFTNVLLTVNPTLTTAGYPTAWTQYTASIAGLSGPTSGRFAFHYNPTNGGPAGANSDFIGVDDVTYIAAGGGTFASNTSLGQGCYSRFNSIYEFFAAGGNDLSGTSWTLTQNTSGGYDVTPGGAAFAAPSGAATAVTLTDDSQATVGTLGLTVCSNGWVATGAGNSDFYDPTPAEALANPSSAIYFWHDMNPTEPGSGQVYYEENGPVAVITFDGVADYQSTGTNQIRVEMIVAGAGQVPQIQVGFGTLSNAGNEWFVGYSEGGTSNDPGSIDLSATALVSSASPESLPLSLTASTRPVLGTTWDLAVGNSALLDLIVIGFFDPNIADLGFLGMPGCGLRANLDALIVGSTLSLPIPNAPSLVGASLFANGVSLAVGVNSFGAISSNGIQGTIGDF